MGHGWAHRQGGAVVVGVQIARRGVNAEGVLSGEQGGESGSAARGKMMGGRRRWRSAVAV